MVTENPSPYQPPSLSGTGEQGSAQKPEPSQTPRTASRFVPMFLAAFVGSLPLFVFFCACKFVVEWCEWSSVFTDPLSICFCQFDSICVDCVGLVPGEISIEFGGVYPRLSVACFARFWPRCVYRGYGELNQSVYP